MATVPTLIVAGVDQTGFIQDKTLYFRRNTLDYTLIDPDTMPELNDITFLDTPVWNGRVTTIESMPFKGGGDDHHYVKVTSTNPLVNVSSTGPFGLSDTPNFTTTFPFKDLTVIRTLVDEVTTLRLTGIVYEPGLLPGHIIPVTVAVEGLSGENVHVTEMSVNWLRDDTPEYHLDLGKDNAQKPTLGDIIDNAGCGCPSFTCTPGDTDFTVKAFDNSEDMACVFPDHINGQTCQSPEDVSSMLYVYDGATYRVDYEVYHAPGPDPVGSNNLTATLAVYGGGQLGTAGPTAGTSTVAPAVNMGDIRGPDGCTFNPADDIPLASVEWTPDFEGYVTAYLSEASCLSGDSFASSISAHLTWLSGPDPRFEGLESTPCEEGLPSPGQPVDEQEFTGDGTTVDYTTALPFMAGSLVILVDGIDWTEEIASEDGATGDYTLSYAPPLGSTVQVRYGYPKLTI